MLLAILRLVRYQNLILIILTQFLIKYGLFNSFGIATTLSNFNFFLLCFATVCIAAAGNIINDIYDIEADNINKSHGALIGSSISEKTALSFYIVLSILGVGTGFYLSNIIGKPGFSAIFIIISALLYIYATYLKHILIVGNIVISILIALVLIIVGLFDLLPAITPDNQQTQSIIFSIILDYAWFAFLINWLREMVKDQEDIKGDYNAGGNSLPIALGRERTNLIIFALSLLPLFSIIYYISNYLYESLVTVVYALLLIIGPLIYFMIKIFTAKTKREFSHLSSLLKLIMFFGLVSIGLYQFILI